MHPLSPLQLHSKGRPSLPSSALPRLLLIPFLLRPLCLASPFLPCLTSCALLRFLPPSRRPPSSSSHLPSPFGSKCKASSWYQVCNFHLISSIICPLVSYTVCVNHSFGKSHTRNHRRTFFLSISMCTGRSLPRITTLSTFIDVQLNLVTTNADFETYRVGFSINIRFQHVQVGHCNISRRKRSPTPYQCY